MRIAGWSSIFIYAAAVLAQEYRGTVLGRVTDPSGGVVPGVQITVTNVETGVAVNTTSNSDGNYQAPFLLPGTYTVTADHTGFKKAEQRNVQVPAATNVTVDLTLQIGSSSETVTVKAEAPLVESASADLGQNIPANYIANVPTSFYRNAANFVRLAPGVTGQSQGTYTSDNQTAVSISGGGNIQGGNEWIIDGVPDTVPLSTGSVVLVPTVDSVQEMRVNTTMFDAEYGHSNGGVITIATKSGTNDLHGTAYLFKRWSALNANTWQNDKNGVAKPNVNYHQWGYYLGGPVYIPRLYNGKNKTFFSTWLESDFDVRDLSEEARVPTALERQGNFSQTIEKVGTARVTIYDPFSTVVSGSRATRQPFSGNMVPTAMQ
ncbi:MAG: carboxypeptidase regulatory-like domain-containing protein, partial [Acidobacteriaceae bacterium]|nr:carboxypeptidase regulatory-like domain-containing protein [Acidobacteriaceae bacterium]